MTREQYQDKHGAKLIEFLQTQDGQAFLTMISSMQPVYEFAKEPHLYADNRGCKRGYELCIRNIVGLTVVQKPIEQPEANYGVPEKPKE